LTENGFGVIFRGVMRLLIQRVSRALVLVENRAMGQIGRGLVILAGFAKGDREQVISRMAEKCLNLRIFEDEAGKMNLSVRDTGGGLLIVSQFTLYANCRKGRRPSFDRSMPPAEAERFYELLLGKLADSGLDIQKGVFGAKMEIELTNDGPVTIMLDSDELFESE